jgi:hypothetical protein
MSAGNQRVLGGLWLGIVVLLAWASGVQAQAACTHYAAPNGSGSSACTSGAPCTIARFLAAFAVPGATLCLLDGTYTGGSQMVVTSSAFNGTPSQPITIRALNDGGATIDGGNSRPVSLLGSYGVLEGVNIAGGDNATVAFRYDSDHWTLRRVVIWNNTSVGADNMVELNGTNVLLEDCGAFGNARKIIAAGAGGAGRPSGSIVRRCWAWWSTKGPTYPAGGPTNTLEMGYGQDGVTFENVLGIRNLAPGANVSEPEAPFTMFRSKNSQWLGSIAYLTSSSVFDTSRLGNFFSDGGSGFQAGDLHPAENVLVKDMVLMAPFHNIQAGRFTADLSNTAQNIVGVSANGGNVTCSSPWNCSNIRSGNSLSAALSGSGHTSIWTYMPGICKRYVNGTLTSQPLWPWPMNQRIFDALGQSGRTAVDITNTMEQLFGTIPTQCKTEGGNTPPNITITIPTSAATWDQGSTTLATLGGTISDANGMVASVTWSCPTCTPTSGSATIAVGGATWSVTNIGVASGDNVITVTATDNGVPALTHSAQLTVHLPTLSAAPRNLRFLNQVVGADLDVTFLGDLIEGPGDAPAVGLRLYRQTNCMGSFVQVNGDFPLSAGTTGIADNDLAPVGSYCWVLRSFTASGTESLNSNQVRWDATGTPLTAVTLQPPDAPWSHALPLLETAVHRAHPLATKLRHWWRVTPERFGGSQLADLVGTSPLLRGNSPTWARPTQPHAAGELQFSAGGETYLQSTTADVGQAAFTVTAWVKEPPATTQSPFAGIVSQVADASWAGGGWVMFVNLDKLGCLLQDGTGNLFDPDDFHPTAWTHIACTWTPGSHELYIDGVLKASGTYAGTLTSTGYPFQVGAAGIGAAQVWTGSINNVKVYRGALSAQEVRQDRALGLTGDVGLLHRPNLLALLPRFSEDQPPVVVPGSGTRVRRGSGSFFLPR